MNCRECDFETNSRQGLKIHKSKVHSKINFEEFPAACNICEKVLDNEDSLKRHKKNEHTFHIVRYQCDECNFMANDITTLHVHFGMHHSVKKKYVAFVTRNLKVQKSLIIITLIVKFFSAVVGIAKIH